MSLKNMKHPHFFDLRLIRISFVALSALVLFSGESHAALPVACPLTAPPSCNSSVTSKCWEIATNGETLGGGSGEFCAAANDGTYVTGTVTRYIFGINEYTVTSCSGNPTDCPTINGSSRYGIEVENVMLAIQPFGPAETLPLVQVAAGTCPSGTYTGNWFWGHLDSTNIANNASQSGFGTFLWDTGSIPARPSVTEFFNMSALTTFGSTISLRAGETCGDTTAGVQSLGQAGDSADQRGGLYFSPSISTLNGDRVTLMYTSSNKVAIGFPRVAITYKADLNGAYAGITWAANSSGLSDINATRMIVNATGTGASTVPFSAPASGTTGGSFADGRSTYTVTISSTNSPRDGMISGTISDGTNPASNIACQAALNVSSGRNVLVCIAPSTTDNTKSRHFIVATQKSQPGQINIAQPFGCPCDPNGRYQTLNASNVCVTNGSAPVCTASTYGGYTKLDAGANYEAGRAVVVASDAVTGIRKIIAAGTCSATSTDSLSLDTGMNSCVARYYMDGQLDTTFNTTGYRSDNFSSGTYADRINALKVLSDGTVLAAGQLGPASATWDMFVAKYTTSGALATFGTSGKTSVAWGGSTKGECDSSKGVCSEAAWGVDTDDSGNIYLAGQTEFYNSTAAAKWNTGAIAKLTSTGTLTTKKRAQADAAFAAKGMRFHTMLHDNSKIYVGGYIDDANSTTTRDSIVVRYDTSLNLDTTYNGTGYNRFAARSSTDGISRDDVVWAMTLDASGRLLVTGGNTNQNAVNMYIARLTSGGALDTTFNGNGMFIFCGCSTNNKVQRWSGTACADDNSGSAITCDYNATVAAGMGAAMNPRAILVQPDGKIVVAGGSSGYFRAARFTLDGSNNVILDTTFASASPTPGLFQTNNGETSIQTFVNATILPYGQIVFTGMVNAANMIISNMSY